MVGWPSGLRRWFKAPVSSDARVRISPQSLFCIASSRVAQWKRVGLITQRSEDRNLPLLRFLAVWDRAPAGPDGLAYNLSIQVSLWPSGLRRAPAKCVGSARTSSNLVGDASLFAHRSGFVAEWSKALDSSSSLHLKAWVRIPPEPY